MLYTIQVSMSSPSEYSPDETPFLESSFEAFYLRRFRPFLSRHDLTLAYPDDQVFGRNGSHRESAWSEETESGWLRVHRIIGRPFVDPTRSGLVGWQTLLTNSWYVYKTKTVLSPITHLTSFPNVSFGIVRSLDLAHFGCRWRTQPWWGPGVSIRPNLENSGSVVMTQGEFVCYRTYIIVKAVGVWPMLDHATIIIDDQAGIHTWHDQGKHSNSRVSHWKSRSKFISQHQKLSFLFW